MRGGGIWGVLGGRFWGENGEKRVRIWVLGGRFWGFWGGNGEKWVRIGVLGVVFGVFGVEMRRKGSEFGLWGVQMGGDGRGDPKMGGGGIWGGVLVFVMGVLR